MDFVPKVNAILDKANTPEEPTEPFKKFDQGEIYNAIIKYYNDFTEVDPISYKFKNNSGEEVHNVDTTLYTPEDMTIDDFSDMTVSYSNHSLDGIRATGLDIEKIWNGESSIVIYDDGELKFGETDYYTSKIFTRSLYIESAHALSLASGDLKDLDDDDFSLRNDMLKSKEQFYDTPSFSSGSSSGGVIIAEHDGEWKMLLGRRSDKPRVNQGLVSVVPNGGVEYQDYEGDKTFKNTLKREFSEETFNSEEDGRQFFEEEIDDEQVSYGWNLRSGSLAIGHALYTTDEGYEQIKNNESTNFEFSELVEVPIMDINEVTDTLKFGNFSPSTIPMVCRCLENFDQREDTPGLPYEILNN